MVVALVLLIVSAILRAGAPADRTVPIALSIVGFLIVTAGAFVGGDVVYVLGNMVSRHAFRGAGTKWIKLDTGDVADLAALPEATPTKMRAGINDLVVVRLGETVHALHAVCAHAGGPLDEGTIVDGCVECPWHALALPVERRARPAGADASTTSRATRSAPQRAAATRCAAARSRRTRREPASCRRWSCPTRASSSSSARPARGSPRSRPGSSPPDEILSSDAMRAAVSGNEADQRASAVAFGILHKTLARRLGRGEMTVVDATNTKAEHRRPLVDRARAAGVPAVALVLDLPPAIIHAQNAARTARVVDPAVVDRHLAAIRRTVDEGQLSDRRLRPRRPAPLPHRSRRPSASNAKGRLAPASRPRCRTGR